MATVLNTPTTPTQITVNGDNVFIFPNIEDANNIWIKDQNGARPVGSGAELPYLVKDNSAGLTTAAIGKFAMLDPSDPTAAVVYAWEQLPGSPATIVATESVYTEFSIHPTKYELLDDEANIVLTITVGGDGSGADIDGADGDDARLQALASYLLNQGYNASASGVTITIDTPANGWTLVTYFDGGGGDEPIAAVVSSGQVAPFAAPTQPVLGKIVDVNATEVIVDNITTRDFCTAIGTVNRQSILFAADGGDGVVDLIEANFVESALGQLYSVGISQAARNNGEQVLVVYGDPMGILRQLS